MEKKSVGRPSNGPKTKVQLFLLDAFIAGRKSPEVANEINEWYLGNTKLGNKVIRNTPEIELPTTKLTNKVIPNSEHTIQAIEAREPELKAQMDQVYGELKKPAFTPNYVKNGIDMAALQAIAQGQKVTPVVEPVQDDEFITAPIMGNRDADALVNRFIEIMRKGASVANCTYMLNQLEDTLS